MLQRDQGAGVPLASCVEGEVLVLELGGAGTEHPDPEEQGQERGRKMGTKGGRRVVGVDAGAFEKGEVRYCSALLEGCHGINQQCNHLGEQTHAATWSGFLDNNSGGAPDARTSHDEGPVHK